MTESLTEDKTQAIVALVAKVLGIAEDELGPDSSIENVPTWDSFEQLNICLAFEQRFGVTLDMETIATSTSIRALAALIS
jgi:acyl carrier protein